MARERQEYDWLIVSEVLAAIYNTIRDPKKQFKPFQGKDFNPLKAKPIPKMSIGELMDMREKMMTGKGA